MELVTSTDISNWAGMRVSQSHLPLLIRKLIFATVDLTKIAFISFPGGDDVHRPGYDGVLSCMVNNAFVPEGESVWEFSCEDKPKSKAERDYQKRKTNTKGQNPSVTTYIYVTARKWTSKQDWVDEKQQEHFWKDIKVFDATDLESWLENAWGVQVWLAEQLGIKMESVDTLKNYVTNWLSITNPQLSSEIANLDRQDQASQLLEMINNKKHIISIKSITIEEVVVFVLESVSKLPDPIRESVLSRMLVVDNTAALRDINRLLISSLILVVKCPYISDVSYSPTHRYIIPLDYSNTASKPDIVIPRIEIRNIVEYLKKIGLTEEQARSYAKNSGGSLSVLKRLFSDIKSQPVWVKSESFKDIFPILVLQSWDTRKEGDNAILQALAGTDKDSYDAILKAFLHQSDSPVIKIGELWRLASAYDTWEALLPYFTKANFDAIRRTAVSVFCDIDPTLKLEPEKRWSAAIEGVIWQYSPDIRKGLVNTLILIAVYGEKSSEFSHSSAQDYVNNIISEILSNPDWYLWHSLSDIMPQLAEAAPNALLSAIERSLNTEGKPILGMFSETDDFLKSSSGHTGLLWALESLAWDEKYTARAVLVLSQLTMLDPGGRLANRPISSLISVFCLWLPQTEADLKTRFEIIDMIMARYPSVAWTLLVGLIPEQHMSGSYNSKYSWRELKSGFNSSVSRSDYLESLGMLAERLINLANHESARLIVLIERLVNFPEFVRERIIEFLTSSVKDIEVSFLEVYSALRKLISSQSRIRHRSYQVLSSDELAKIKTIYNTLTPKSVALKQKYLFDELFPDLFNEDLTYEEEENSIAKSRTEAALLIIKELPTDALFDYINTISQPRLLAIALPVDYFLDNMSQILDRLDSKSPREVEFAQGVITKTGYELGSEWGIDLLNQGINEHWNNDKIVNLLLCLKPTRDLWGIITRLDAEIIHKYWSKFQMNPYEASIDDISYAIEQLMLHQRYYSALENAWIKRKELPTELCVKLLLETVKNQCSEPVNQMIHHYMEELIKLVSENDKVPSEDKVKIEWAYIPILTSLSSGVTPKYLHTEMSSDPISFLMIIGMISKPKGVEIKVEEQLTEDEVKNKQIIANNAWHLLDSWKMLPGLQTDGSVDYTQLKQWVDGVIDLAKQQGYVDICFCYIGKILAHSPVDVTGQWPVDAVCQILEEQHNSTIDNNFYCEEKNKRGTTVRSPYDGGDQERVLVQKYTNYAHKLMSRYPHTAQVVTEIAEGYAQEAHREDIHAEENRLLY